MAAPDTPSRLHAAREQILNSWEQRVRAEAGATTAEEHLALRNSLLDVLNGLVTTLGHSDPSRALAAEEKRLAVDHGRLRALNPAYTLDQVIREYHVLRTVLFEVLESEGNTLSLRERDLIWEVLFASIRNAASVFKEARDVVRDQRSQVREQMLRTIFDRVEDYAIFTLDAGGHVTSWAMGAQKMKQYTSDEIIGQHYRILYPDDGQLRREPERHLEDALRAGRFRGEGLRRRKDGAEFLADVSITPMYEGDTHVGFFKVVTDLTERNRVIQERDLTRARAETLELEADLRERFVFTLTHDLKNPLSAARSCAELILKEACAVDRHRDLAVRSLHTLERVDHMVTDLLDASRIKSGQPVPLNIVEYDAVDQLGQIREDFSTVYGDRVRVTSGESCRVFWDRHAMRRVLENLVTNALKYGDANGVVDVAVKCAAARVFLTVHNVGSPIAVADQEMLFELFHRTRAAEKGGKRGWGLGLTLVRGIAEAHGGVVAVRSVDGEGTTFTLDLPTDARRA